MASQYAQKQKTTPPPLTGSKGDRAQGRARAQKAPGGVASGGLIDSTTSPRPVQYAVPSDRKKLTSLPHGVRDAACPISTG